MHIWIIELGKIGSRVAKVFKDVIGYNINPLASSYSSIIAEYHTSDIRVLYIEAEKGEQCANFKKIKIEGRY